MTVRTVAISIAVTLSGLATTAQADEAALANAVAAYNALPSRTRGLAFASTEATPGQKVTSLPGWLAEARLTDREAAATAAAYGVYGNDFGINFRSRNWSTAEVIAGTVVDVVAYSVGANRAQELPPAGFDVAPSRALTEGRRTALLSALNDMQSCTGALVRAQQKLSKLRASDDATRLLLKAQRDLGATALPPDDACL